MFTKPRQVRLALILALLISLLNTMQVQAGTMITVNTLEDLYTDGPAPYCSLRMAIVAANENRKVGACAEGSPSSPDLIWLPSAGPYLLYLLDSSNTDTHLGDLDITQSVSISGVAVKSTIKANPTQLKDRLFHVKNGSTVVFKNLVIEGGNTTGASGDYNTGRGGGILNESGNVTIDNCTITGNQGPTAGGGIENHQGSTLRIIGSTIQSNSSSYGGGIFNDGTVNISNSLVFNNNATQIGGGLLNNDSYSARMYLENVTISSNQGPADGWGIFNLGLLEVKNSTIANNTQSGTGSGSAVFVGNTSTGFLVNTIIAKHAKNCSINKVGFSKGSNLEDRNDCGFSIASGDQINTNPLLASELAFNNGGTQNYALLENSLAINKGNNAYCPINDQRGLFFSRADGACDIGSFEFGAVETILSVYLPSVRR